MKKPPCIRGLDAYKKGCPMRCWDGESGCPAWAEVLVTPKNEPLKPKDKRGACIDMWQHEFQLTMLGLLEGNQRAVESFRNGMVVQAADGVVVPRPDPAVVRMVELIEENQRVQSAVTAKLLMTGK